VDAMIEGTIDEAGMWLYGRIHLALVDLYETYRPKSRLDRIQLDMDKLLQSRWVTVIIRMTYSN
jgi:hypothetical protein